MPHMKPQVVRMTAYLVDHGSSTIVPASVLSAGETAAVEHYLQDKEAGEVDNATHAASHEALRRYLDDGGGLVDIEKKTGYFARLSAPGYLDCTEWSGPFDSKKEALRDLCETHDIDKKGVCMDEHVHTPAWVDADVQDDGRTIVTAECEGCFFKLVKVIEKDQWQTRDD